MSDREACISYNKTVVNIFLQSMGTLECTCLKINASINVFFI